MQQEKIPKEGNYCFQIGRNVSKIVCEEQIRLAGEVSACSEQSTGLSERNGARL